MKPIITMILAGGKSERMLVLTRLRSKTALPFGGKYRIIDFALSNCVHSGLYDIAVLAQYTPQSLHAHIRKGGPWDLDRRSGGVRILQPYVGSDAHWYRGTADALHQNIELFDRERYDYVLVLSGDHVYKMDYRKFIDFHRDSNLPISVACAPIPPEELSRFGCLELDDGGRVVKFVEKPKLPTRGLASMGIYIFNREFLVSLLKEVCGAGERYDLVYDIIIPQVEEGRVAGYEFGGYWEDIGTVKSYYRCSMDLLAEFPRLNLHDPRWQIITRPSEQPPMSVQGGTVVGSLVDNGCIIRGEVRNSILFPGVYVDSEARVSDAIVLSGVYVGPRAVVDCAVVDKDVFIGEGAIVGCGDRRTVNEDYPDLLDEGLTIVGKGTAIPEGARIGRNCCLDCFLRAEDFPNIKIPSGTTIRLKEEEIFNRGQIDFPVGARDWYWE